MEELIATVLTDLDEFASAAIHPDLNHMAPRWRTPV
jgi:hypothetical protein